MSKDRMPYSTIPAGAVAKVPELSGAAAKLLVAIGCHINGKMGVCWPSIERLQRLSGIKSRSTFYKALHELEDADIISRYPRPSGRKSGGWVVQTRWVDQPVQELDTLPPRAASPETGHPATEITGATCPKIGQTDTRPTCPKIDDQPVRKLDTELLRELPQEEKEEKDSVTASGDDDLFPAARESDSFTETEPKEKEPTARDFVKWFADRFEEKTGSPYTPAWGKEGRILKGPLEIHGFKRLKGFAEIFFSTPDTWVGKTGYSILIFFSQLNRITGGAFGDRPKDIGRNFAGAKDDVDKFRIAKFKGGQFAHANDPDQIGKFAGEDDSTSRKRPLTGNEAHDIDKADALAREMAKAEARQVAVMLDEERDKQIERKQKRDEERRALPPITPFTREGLGIR